MPQGERRAIERDDVQNVPAGCRRVDRRRDGPSPCRQADRGRGYDSRAYSRM